MLLPDWMSTLASWPFAPSIRLRFTVTLLAWMISCPLMSWLSITVPGFVTVTVPWTTVSFVPGGMPVFVGPGLPGGSGTVGVGVGLGVGFAVGLGVGFGVGLGFGFGLVVGVPTEFEADDEEPVAEDADVDAGPVDEPGTTEPGELEPGRRGARPRRGLLTTNSLAVADCAEPAFVAGNRSMTAATMRPPSSTSTSVTTTTRSRTEPGIGMAGQIALTAATSLESESFASPKNRVVLGS